MKLVPFVRCYFYRKAAVVKQLGILVYRVSWNPGI